MSFLDGKKTYLIALIVAVQAGAKALGYEIPNYVFDVLAALGLYTVRDAIAKK